MDSDTHESMMEQLDTIEEKSVRQMKKISEAHHLFFVDVHINCSKFILPGHKYILSARSEILREQLQSGVNELDWTDYEPEIGHALLKWMYTDTIVLENETFALCLLRASYNFQLHTLFGACERANELHGIAEKVGANKLAEACMRFRSVCCDDSHTAIATQKDNSGDRDFHDLLVAQGLTPCERGQQLLERLRMMAKRQDKISKMSAGIYKFVKCSDLLARGKKDWWLHSYVLTARSEKSREEILTNKNLSWYTFSNDSARALLRWLYTDVISLDSENLGIDLIKAAHDYKLTSLFKLCEELLVKTVNITSCAKLHRLAKDVGALTLSKQCTHIVFVYWDGLQTQEFSKLFGIAMEKEKRMPGGTDGSLATEMTVYERELSSMETSKGLLTLNDDCLFHVFRYMSLVDLGSLKDACQRLNQLVDRSFKIYRPKSLTIDSSSMIADLWILKHFGKFINSLTLRGCFKHYSSFEDIFVMIAKCCNVKLQTISLNLNYEENVSDETLKCLEEIMKNVEVVHLEGFHHSRQIDLLLCYCKNLKEVSIEGEEMDLSTIWCSKNCNLKRISLDGLYNDDILEKISETMPDLEYLAFDYIDETDMNKISHLTRLNHLKHLQIGSHYENIGNFLKDVSKKNLLEYLGLSYSVVDESVVYAIGQFTKLKELHLCQMDIRMNDNVIYIFSKLNNIEKLSFVECEEISFGDITKIIKDNLKLKEVQIYGCFMIDFVDRDNYLRLRKRRNLKICLDKLVYENSIKLIANDLSQYVQLATKPSK